MLWSQERKYLNYFQFVFPKRYFKHFVKLIEISVIIPLFFRVLSLNAQVLRMMRVACGLLTTFGLIPEICKLHQFWKPYLRQQLLRTEVFLMSIFHQITFL